MARRLQRYAALHRYADHVTVLDRSRGAVMDEVFNAMQLGPQQTAPVEDDRTLSERLRRAERVIRHQKREIQILEELRMGEKSPGERRRGAETFRRKKQQLLFTQMYGEEGQLFEDYRDLGAGANNDQQPPDVGPEEFMNVGDFLLDDGPRPLVQQDHFNTSNHADKPASGKPKDMDASDWCESCGTLKRIFKGAANFNEKACPMCDMPEGDDMDLGGIGIPGRGDPYMHQMQEYGFYPFQINSTSSMGGSRRGSPEQCTFCDGVLPSGSGQSHLSSCPEYHRWSGASGNDSFFYHYRNSLKKDKGGSWRSSPQLVDASFPAHYTKNDHLPDHRMVHSL